MKPENLVLKIGHDILRIDLYNEYVTKNPTCRITCIEDDTCSQNLDGEWIEEHNEAVIYLKKEHIDKVIDKLNEAKAFLA